MVAQTGLGRGNFVSPWLGTKHQLSEASSRTPFNFKNPSEQIPNNFKIMM